MPKHRRKKKPPKRSLALPDLEQTKSAVLNSLTSKSGALTVDSVQLREEHWVIADLHGKTGDIRTVPIPLWVMEAMDRWIEASGIKEGDRANTRSRPITNQPGFRKNADWITFPSDTVTFVVT
jgi:hypothetical protein